MSQANEENQQCFIPAHWEEASIETSKDHDFIYLNINRLLEQAKELQNRTKPQNMQPRTCFIELPLKKLPQFLQQPCIEAEPEQNETGPYQPIENPDHLSLQQYFQDHEVVYNKMKMYKHPHFELTEPTSRFKPISLLFDFHDKLFKQLYQNDEINSPTSVAINDQFDSTFESGNLGLVFKKEDSPERQYFLLLENDVNSHGYTSWFFFKVKSCGRGRAFFHILNLSKSPYLYKIGWKISTFSVAKFHENGTRWFKGGKNIQTYATNFQKKVGGGNTYSCMYFEYEFEQNQSDVYFAMSRPYTYSMLTKSIQKMESLVQSEASNADIQVIKTVYSISCNIIPIILLTQRNSSKEDCVMIEQAKFPSKKKVLVFMARQHPGEVIGSNLMDKIMEILSMQSEEVRQLVNRFTVVLIPMANPDGVIHGNSRCNFSGLDLNRQWMKQCLKEVTPETYSLRKFLWLVQESIGIEYVIDLHGHSKKMNSFFFCNKVGDKYPSEYLPYVMSKLNKRFDLGSSTFNTTSDKKNTLRNQLYEKGMKNCITVECSYFGYWSEKTAKLFKDQDFVEMADSLLKTLCFMLFQESPKFQICSEAFEFSREAVMSEVKACRETFAKKSTKLMENDDIQSESDPEADIMKPDQMLRIYERDEGQLKKKQSSKKKSRTRKLKETKREPEKDDQIRASEPMKMYKEMNPQAESKTHKSEKKLEPVVNSKKSITQLKFREAQKPVFISQKKQSTRKQEVIRQKVININEEQVDTGSKQMKQIKTKGKVFGVPFPKQNYQNYLNKCNKSRLIQTRFRTEVETSKSRIEREVGNYGKIKEESIKIFLNETLSISKVNQGTSTLSEIKARKSSLKSEKNLEKVVIPHNENRNQLRMPLEIDNSKGMSISREKEERKKYLCRNYKKEIVRRKKILSTQDQVKKYKRFQSFMTNQEKEDERKSVRPECSSVFYYFPLL